MIKKLLLIDLDDTLWATYVNNKRSIEELYTALNWGQYFVSFEAFFDLYYSVNVELWEQYNRGEIDKATLSRERLRRPLSSHLELSDQECERIDTRYLALVREQTLLCPNALEVMRYLKPRYRICLLSNGFSEVQQSKVTSSGLAPYIDNMVLSEDLGINKPRREIFDYALERMGVGHAEAVMIGDSFSSDIVGASNAGIDSIWYNAYRFPMPVLEGVTPPRYIVHDLAELLELL